jgi:hypothetical protein
MDVLVEFDGEIASEGGEAYHARVLGAPDPNGLWVGWLEFIPVRGDGPPRATERETTQPNRADLDYWATGLSRVYLEGALTRALDRAAERPSVDATRNDTSNDTKNASP